MIHWPEMQPQLSDSRLCLRPVVRSDAPVMFAYINGDPEIMEFTTVPDDYSIETAENAVEIWDKSFANKEAMQFAITLADDTMIGHVSLHAVNFFDHHAEVGYIMNRDYRGQGIAPAAVELVADYAFAIGFRRLNAFVIEGNPASERVLHKAGFHREAVLAKYMTTRGGEQVNGLLYAKISADG